jgi:hypothetical protein
MDAPSSTLPMAPNHINILLQAIQNVLSTQIAEDTMAQLVDGLPTEQVAADARGCLMTIDHPLIKEHGKICEPALARTRELRANFSVSQISFDDQVRQTVK